MPVSMHEVYIKSDSLVHREIADEVILVPIRRHVADLNSLYSLDGVGPRIWELVDGQRSVQVIVDMILEEYAVDQGTAEADVIGFVSDLESIGALKRA
jgi:hypothetical protein